MRRNDLKLKSKTAAESWIIQKNTSSILEATVVLFTQLETLEFERSEFQFD